MDSFEKLRKEMQEKYGKKNEETEGNQRKLPSDTTSSNERADRFEALRKEMTSKYDLSSKVDEDFIDAFATDASRYFEQAKGDYEKLDYATAYKIYDSQAKSIADLRARRGAISQYLKKNRELLSPESYESLSSWLDDMGAALDGYHKSFYDAKNHFYQGSAEDYFKKNVFDVDAAYREIEALWDYYDKAFDLYYVQYADTKHNPGEYTEEERADITRRYNELIHKYDSIEGLEQTILEKERALEQAERQLEGFKLSDVAVPGSDLYDPEFSKYTGYAGSTWVENGFERTFTWDESAGMKTGYDDIRYDFINDPDTIQAKLIKSSGTADHHLLNGLQVYRHMDENEIAIYNYYYAKDGKEAADRFLDSIQESLNQRRAGERFESMEGNTLLELAFGVEAGLDQFRSGMKGALNSIVGNDEYTPATATQMLSGMVREDLKDVDLKWYNFKEGKWDNAKILGNSLGQLGYDAVTTTSNMAPSILASTAIGLINPTAGAVVGNSLLGTSAAGNAYQEKINLGYSGDEARAYGFLVGASEATLQYLLGGISALGQNTLSKTALKNLDAVDNVFARFAKSPGGKLLLSGGSEAIEEGLQSIIEPYLWQAVSGETASIDLEEALYSALMGFVTGGVFEGVDVARTAVAQNIENKRIYGADPNGLVSEALEINPDNAFAQKMQGRLDSGKQLSGGQLNRLVQQNEAALTAQDMANIQSAAESRLAELGETGDVSAIAAALAKQAAGKGLSRAERQMISGSKYGQRVANELTTDNIKSGEHSSAWAEKIDTQRINAEEYSRLVEAAQLPQESAEVTEGQVFSTEAPKAAQAVQAEPVEAPAANDAAASADAYSVSEDAETIYKGENVSINRIADSQNGQMMLELKDGRTVPANQLSYANEGQALVYEAVASLGVDATIANLLIDPYLKDSGGVAAKDYALGMVEAFWNGSHNIAKEDGQHSGKLTPLQRNNAYYLGERYGGKATATAEAKLQRARMAMKYRQAEQPSIPPHESSAHTASAQGKTNGVYYGYEGQSIDERLNVGKKLNAAQRVGVDFAQRLAKSRGISVYFYESYMKNGQRVYRDRNGKEALAENGFYDPSDRSIHIDLNAGAMGQGTMLFTIAHELVHFIKDTSPKHFKQLSNLLMRGYKAKGQSVHELIDAQQAFAKAHGRELTREEAYDEVVADSMESILADGRVMELMQDLEETDKSLAATVKKFFRDIAKLVKKTIDAYKGYKPDSVEGRLVASMEDIYRQLQEVFAEGVYQGSENTEFLENSVAPTEGLYYSKRKGYQKPFFKENVFPSYNESQSEAHELAERWARSPHTQSGDQKLISFHRTWFRIEAFDNLKYGYQIIKKLTAKEYRLEAKDYGEITDYESLQSTSDKNAALLRGIRESGGRGYRVDPSLPEYRGKDNPIHGVGSTQNRGRSNEHNSARDHASSGLDRQGENGSSLRDEVKLSSRKGSMEAVQETLEAENEKLRSDVDHLKELLKLQRTVTGGTKFTKTSVEAAARVLKQAAGAKGDTKELAGVLNSFYEYIAGSKELTWEDVKEQAQPAVEWLQSHVVIKKELSDYAKDILHDVRTSRIFLSDAQQAEVAYRYGSFNNFRKSAMGSVTIAKDGVSLDSQWQEWSAMYPDIFDSDVTATDMPMALMDILDSLRNSDLSQAEYAYHADMISQDLLRQVYDSYWRVSTMYTLADINEKRLNALKGKHYQQMTKLRESHREKSEQLKQEHRENLAQVRKEYRESSEAQQQKIRQHYQESRKQAIDSRNRTQARHKVQRVVKELNSLLLSGDKERHVPEDMQKALAALLDSVNMDTVGAEERIAKYEALIAQETDELKIDAYQGTIENIQSQGANLKQRLLELHNAYGQFINSDDPDIANAFDPVINAAMEELTQTIGNTALRDMTLEQLEDTYSVLRAVLTRVRDANKAFMEGRAEGIREMATRAAGEIRKAGGEHTHRASMADPVKKFLWNNQKPVYAMEKLGSTAMTDTFMELINGEGIYALDVDEAAVFATQAKEKYGYSKWDWDRKYTFEDTSGKQFELTLAQIMSLYAYSKREAAHDHLRLGGFVFDSSIETYKVKEKNGKQKRSIIKYKVNTAQAHQIGVEVLGQISEHLSPEQRAFVDQMQEYLSATMGAKGNEVSQKMYGVKLFKEKFYFPLKSARQYLFEQNEVAGEVRIKNSGFTNKLKPRANNPVILNNFMDVWAQHVHDMSMYHAFVLPLEDFNRIFNYTSPKQEGVPSVSVKGTIQSAYGPAAVDYFKQLITDLNGGARSDPRESIGKQLLGQFKKASVFASASVVIQQPSAIIRARALVDERHFSHLNPKLISHRKLWAEVKKYAPVAIIKEMGHFDMDTGRSTVDYIKGDKTFMNKVDDLLSAAPAKADEWAWVQIWYAIKRETAYKNPQMVPTSEDFLKLAGKRFTEVIVKTQVYDSTLSRSANMRSKSGLMNMATAFMAEPTTSINMLEHGFRLLKRGDKKGAWKNFTAVYGSVLLNASLVAMVYAARDDDEDETYAEKYIESFTTEILDGINPLTYYPWVKDIWSIAQGFDVDRSDMSLINDVFDKVNRLGKVLHTDTEGMDAEQRKEREQQILELYLSLGDSVGALLGIPVKNVRRDVMAAINTFTTLKTDFTERDTTWQTVKDTMEDAVMNAIPVAGWMPGESRSDRLYQAIVSGDESYRKRMEDGYSSDNALKTAVRKGLKENDPRITQMAEAFLDGDYDTLLDLRDDIHVEGNFVYDTIDAAFESRLNELKKQYGLDEETAFKPDTDEENTIFSAQDFLTAIMNGNTDQAEVVREDMLRFMDEKSFSSKVTSACREQFKCNAIVADEAVHLLEKYGGIDRSEATEKVAYWNFQVEYPKYADWSQGDVTKYYDYAKAVKISLDKYSEYLSRTEGIGQKTDKLRVIDRLDLTDKQKDALYFSNGWAESTLDEAPWH